MRDNISRLIASKFSKKKGDEESLEIHVAPNAAVGGFKNKLAAAMVPKSKKEKEKSP